MATELIINAQAATVTSGGTTAPAAMTVETWSVTTTTSGWPTLTAGQQFRAMDELDIGKTSGYEVFLVTANSSTWTVTRAIEGVTWAHAASFTLVPAFSSGGANNRYLKASSSLADITTGGGSVATARTSLGLGTAATMASSAFLQATNNLSELANSGTARGNLGIRFYNIVKDYGADPTGVADSSSAFTSAVNAATGNAGLTIIYCPQGTYLITATAIGASGSITVPATQSGDILFLGDGDLRTIFLAGTGGNTPVNTNGLSVFFEGICFDAGGMVGTPLQIRTQYANGGGVSSCQSAGGTTIYLGSNVGVGVLPVGSLVALQNTHSNFQTTQCYVGIVSGYTVGAGTGTATLYQTAGSSTFTLTWNSNTTGSLNWNASASTIQTALRALSGGSGISCAGGPLGTTIVTVTGLSTHALTASGSAAPTITSNPDTISVTANPQFPAVTATIAPEKLSYGYATNPIRAGVKNCRIRNRALGYTIIGGIGATGTFTLTWNANVSSTLNTATVTAASLQASLNGANWANTPSGGFICSPLGGSQIVIHGIKGNNFSIQTISGTAPTLVSNNQAQGFGLNVWDTSQGKPFYVEDAYVENLTIENDLGEMQESVNFSAVERIHIKGINYRNTFKSRGAMTNGSPTLTMDGILLSPPVAANSGAGIPGTPIAVAGAGTPYGALAETGTVVAEFPSIVTMSGSMSGAEQAALVPGSTITVGAQTTQVAWIVSNTVLAVTTQLTPAATQTVTQTATPLYAAVLSVTTTTVNSQPVTQMTLSASAGATVGEAMVGGYGGRGPINLFAYDHADVKDVNAVLGAYHNSDVGAFGVNFGGKSIVSSWDNYTVEDPFVAATDVPVLMDALAVHASNWFLPATVWPKLSPFNNGQDFVFDSCRLLGGVSFAGTPNTTTFNGGVIGLAANSGAVGCINNPAGSSNDTGPIFLNGTQANAGTGVLFGSTVVSGTNTFEYHWIGGSATYGTLNASFTGSHTGIDAASNSYLTKGLSFDAYFESGVRANTIDQLTAPAGPVSWNSQKLQNLAAGVLGTDAVNMNQLSGLSPWVADANWTQTSATTFTLVGNQTANYTVGTVLKWQESSTQKYGVVSSSAFTSLTTVTMVATSTYTMAASPDAATNFYSPQGSVPSDFPANLTWSATSAAQVGWSGTPTYIGQFSILPGRNCKFNVFITGTSNATTASITVPFTAAGIGSSSNFNSIAAQDSGTNTVGFANVGQGSNSLSFGKGPNVLGAAWTNSGGKIVTGQLIFPF